MEFRILGPLEVVDGDQELTPPRPKQRALLALLLLHANEVVASDELLETLWAGRPPKSAPTALHGHVSSLRKLLGAEAIETRPPGYALRLGREQIDLWRFEAILEKGRRELDPARKRELLQSALALFRGEPLADFRYEAFARDEAARIEELRLLALEERIEADLALGSHEDLIPELERLVAANRLHERLRGQLILALYRAGRQAEALQVYQEGRQELAGELGLDPGPVLRELERRVLSHDPSLALPEAVPAAAARPRRERKRVTVLVCDLLGFAGRSPQHDPEDERALFEPHLATVGAELERFGGTIERVLGNTVMGVFGAPAVHEDDPERAVRAALAIRQILPEELGLRIAVETGEALVTLYADPPSGEGGVEGDVVTTALRLQAASASDTIIVGEQTFRASDDAIAYRELEPVLIGGKDEPLRVWKPVALQVADERPATKLVGRRRELDQLAGVLARAEVERALELVTILGVPGIGKTRLVRELYALVEADPRRIAWLEGRSLPYGDGVTFWALGEIVKAQAGVFESDRPEVVEEKLLLAVEETLAEEKERLWMLRHLRMLVGLAGEGQARGETRDEAFAAWRHFFAALAEETPLVLVVEDLHWADDGLLDFVDELAAGATDAPMLFVVTSRPELLERRPEWGGGKRNATTIWLAPLSDEETELLLTALLGGEAAEDLVELAQGNPLYAEEYARLVLERGSQDQLSVPESLHALIAARLDVLSAEEKAVLQDAAVVGEVAWAGAIEVVGDRERSAVSELADSLERKEFLRFRRRSSVEGEAEYAFGHVLVRDVVYGQIPRAERGAKHRLAAEWIESLGRREDHVELLAHHYVRALELADAAGAEATELVGPARLALRDAGHRAAVLGALPSAARFFGQALELWPEGDPERGRLLLRQARALLFSEISGEKLALTAAETLWAAEDWLGAADAEALLVALYQEEGRGELVREHLRRASELVGTLPPSTEKAQVLAEICRSRMMTGEHEESLRAGSEALELCAELGLDEIRAAVLNCMGPARLDAGDVEGAVADLELGIAVAVPIGSHEAAHGYGNLSNVLMSLGDLQGSYAARRAGLEHAERHGLRWYIRWLRIEELSELYFTRGEWDRLLALAEEFVREQTILATPAYDLRIRVRLARGGVDGAVDDAEQVLALATGAGDRQALLPALSIAAFAKLAAGDRTGCAALADKLLESTSWSSVWSHFYAAPLLGVVLHALGRGDELAIKTAAVGTRTVWLEAGLASASGDFARACEIYERIGDRPDEAFARLKIAEQLIAEGRHEDARDQLARALAFFRSVGASAYARDAEALVLLVSD